MENIYWHKQTVDTPLFQDLLWSKPEHKSQAGKLLIIGGNLHGFSTPAEAYQAAGKAGVGRARVLLPDAVKQIAGRLLETVDYGPSTPSGSFSQKALGDFIEHAEWADGVLLAGDLGRNSETAILLEKFTKEYQGELIITKDAVDYFYNSAASILERQRTTLVLSLSQLQRLAVAAGYASPFLFSMNLLQLVDALHFLSLRYRANILVKHLENLFVASGGRVSTTKLKDDMEIWRAQTAAKASVWMIQNPDKPFEALTTAIYEMQNGGRGGNRLAA